MKHFLKPFGPGEDRFADFDTDIVIHGSPIIKDAIFCSANLELAM